MPTILVAYTTNAGSTEEVAQAVAQALSGAGAQVDVRRLETVDSLEGYSAVVVGGPMILGWSRAAVRFVRRYRRALRQLPTAYFFTALSLTRLDSDRDAPFPVFIDPALGEPPRNPPRLSFKERYATLNNYLSPARKAAPDVSPVSAAFLGGKLELFRLKWWQALFVMLVIGARPGDQRNWEAIRQWAAELAPRLVPENQPVQPQAVPPQDGVEAAFPGFR